MADTFQMSIRDVFFLRDGRTVLAGPIDGGEKVIVVPGRGVILVNGVELATVQIEPEMIPSRALLPVQRVDVRVVSTLDLTGLTRDMISTKECKLEGTMRVSGHRHLVGIDSPPADYIPDDMTLGPRLPEGWDGDGWMKPAGDSYFLRAWNKGQARYAVATGTKYEEARKRLLDEIAGGGKRVEIRATETSGRRS
jgi:hypothetical protein